MDVSHFMDVLLKDTSYELKLVWYSIILLSITVWIYSMIDIVKSSFEEKDYYTWILVVGLVPVLGPILYLFIGRKRKLKRN
jgi:membrane protein YdbS with pleckstrin-like domain